MASILGGPIGAFAVLLVAAVMIPFLADRLRVPRVFALPLAGMALGPWALGLVQPESGSQLGTMGMYFLFFAAGAAIDLAAIRRHPSRSAGAAASFALIPFAAGVAFASATALLLPTGGPAPAFYLRTILPILACGLVFASAGSGQRYQAIKLGLGRDKAAAIAAGGSDLARIATVTALALLSLLGNPDSGVFGAAASAAFLAGALFLLPPLVSLFFRKTRLDGGTEVVFILSLVAFGSWLAHLSGIGAETGAFAMGLALGSFIPDASPTAARMGFVGESFITPVFLVWIGASIDLGAFAAYPVVSSFAALGLAAVALFSRYLAAKVAAASGARESGNRDLLRALSSDFDRFSLALAASISFSFALPPWFPIGFVLVAGASEALAGRTLHRIARASAQPPARPGRTEASAHAGRILVAISKPESAHSLMELAFLIRDGESQAPVFPLAVVSETQEGKSGFARAEDMLASALVQSVSSSVPVVPVTRMAMNISKGILQAAIEQGTDSVIIGWNKPPRLANAFFGSVIEQVVTGCGLLTIVARLPSELSSIRQLIIIAPPTCESHPGFSPALAALRNLASNLQARTMLVTLKPHAERLSAAFAEVGRFGGLQTLEVTEWRSLAASLKGSGPDASRMFVLLSARPGERSWHPAVERLPHVLGEDFSASSLLMAYLPSGAEGAAADSGTWSETACDDEENAAGTQPSCRSGGEELLREAVSMGRVLPDMKEPAVADGIRSIMEAAFPGNRRLAIALAGTFTEIAQRNPIELEQGVVLLHARATGIDRPVISFGAHRQGFRLSALEAPARILVLICVPEGQSPESHLEVLGEIARLFKERGLAARLLEAEDAAALRS